MSHKASQQVKTLNLALYQPWIYLHGGLERSILELVTRSRHRWTIYTGYYDPAGTFPEFQTLDIRPLRRTSIDRGIVSVLKSSLKVASQRLPVKNDTDGIVIWCDGIGDMATFRNRSHPLFNICSTPLRAVFDPAYEEQALGQRNWLGRIAYRAFKYAFQKVDRLAWSHYRGVIATSKEVESRIIAGRLSASDKIVLSHPGVNWSPQVPDVAYEPFALVSGRIMWTKNIELAISSFIEARLPDPWKLVIAGFVDKKSVPYLAKLQAMAGGRNDIEFVVSPSDDELQDLLRRASFMMFTPLNEDWGIAPLEAMSQAKPVIAVNAGGPRESVADGYSGYLLEPNVKAWASCISSLAADPERIRQLGTQAHAHVERFTWARFAEAVDVALDDWVAQAASCEPEASRTHWLRVAGRRLRMGLGARSRAPGLQAASNSQSVADE